MLLQKSDKHKSPCSDPTCQICHPYKREYPTYKRQYFEEPSDNRVEIQLELVDDQNMVLRSLALPSAELMTTLVTGVSWETSLFGEIENRLPKIENVFVDEKASVVVVEWGDGTKTQATAGHGDPFSLEGGFGVCVSKKLFGSWDDVGVLLRKKVKYVKDGKLIKDKKYAHQTFEESKKKKERQEKIAKEELEANIRAELKERMNKKQ